MPARLKAKKSPRTAAKRASPRVAKRAASPKRAVSPKRASPRAAAKRASPRREKEAKHGSWSQKETADEDTSIPEQEELDALSEVIASPDSSEEEVAVALLRQQEIWDNINGQDASYLMQDQEEALLLSRFPERVELVSLALRSAPNGWILSRMELAAIIEQARTLFAEVAARESLSKKQEAEYTAIDLVLASAHKDAVGGSDAVYRRVGGKASEAILQGVRLFDAVTADVEPIFKSVEEDADERYRWVTYRQGRRRWRRRRWYRGAALPIIAGAALGGLLASSLEEADGAWEYYWEDGRRRRRHSMVDGPWEYYHRGGRRYRRMRRRQATGALAGAVAGGLVAGPIGAVIGGGAGLVAGGLSEEADGAWEYFWDEDGKFYRRQIVAVPAPASARAVSPSRSAARSSAVRVVASPSRPSSTVTSAAGGAIAGALVAGPAGALVGGAAGALAGSVLEEEADGRTYEYYWDGGRYRRRRYRAGAVAAGAVAGALIAGPIGAVAGGLAGAALSEEADGHTYEYYWDGGHYRRRRTGAIAAGVIGGALIAGPIGAVAGGLAGAALSDESDGHKGRPRKAGCGCQAKGATAKSRPRKAGCGCGGPSRWEVPEAKEKKSPRAKAKSPRK